MKRCQLGAHTKHDLKVHLVWIPKYRKRVLRGKVALRVRDLIRQIAMEYEIVNLSRKVASDHIDVLVQHRPHADASMIVQWLKCISSRILLQEFAHLRKAFGGRHLGARGYPAREMLQWPHSGFHVHTGVGVSEDDRPFALRLARYCARNPKAVFFHEGGPAEGADEVTLVHGRFSRAAGTLRTPCGGSRAPPRARSLTALRAEVTVVRPWQKS